VTTGECLDLENRDGEMANWRRKQLQKDPKWWNGMGKGSTLCLCRAKSGAFYAHLLVRVPESATITILTGILST